MFMSPQTTPEGNIACHRNITCQDNMTCEGHQRVIVLAGSLVQGNFAEYYPARDNHNSKLPTEY